MFDPAPDAKLVARALAGSNRAWMTLVSRYERRVYNYALRMVGHPDDAFDLMQEVFLGVFRNLGSFRGEGPFPAWLFRIASFRCTDYLRRRRPMEEFDEYRVDGDDSETPEAGTITAMQNRRLLQAMAQLSTEQRQVLELKFFQHFTFEDIAVQLGISPNTAKTRMYSALRKLKECEELHDAL